MERGNRSPIGTEQCSLQELEMIRGKRGLDLSHTGQMPIDVVWRSIRLGEVCFFGTQYGDNECFVPRKVYAPPGIAFAGGGGGITVLVPIARVVSPQRGDSWVWTKYMP